MSENIEQAVREVARFLATDPNHVTGENTRHAKIIVAIVERNLTKRALDVCRYRWGEGMETGEHSYSNGVCGKCGKHP